MASASSTLSFSPKTSLPEWKKMKVQELRDLLASKGLETNGIKSSLIERLESSAKPEDSKTVIEGLNRLAEASEGKADSEVPHNIADQAEPSKYGEKLGSSGSSDKISITEHIVVSEIKEASKPKEKIISTRLNVISSPKSNGIEAGATSPLSETEKKKLRAERFGVEFQMSEEEKRRLRAARFEACSGGSEMVHASSNAANPASKEAEADKRKARALRFGTSESPQSSPSYEDAKKKARLLRFGSSRSITDLPLEDEKRKARAVRFGAIAKEEILDRERHIVA